MVLSFLYLEQKAASQCWKAFEFFLILFIFPVFLLIIDHLFLFLVLQRSSSAICRVKDSEDAEEYLEVEPGYLAGITTWNLVTLQLSGVSMLLDRRVHTPFRTRVPNNAALAFQRPVPAWFSFAYITTCSALEF